MDQEGIVLCADICNTANSFRLKEKSAIRYINLLEVFGIDPVKAEHRLNEIFKIADIASGLNLAFSIVPHSVYSMSLSLFRLLRKEGGKNRLTTIHFMESEGEKTFLETQSGPIMNSFKNSGLIPSRLETVNNHADAILNEVGFDGNLLLVHNTFADRKTVRQVKKRKNLYWCLCPNSNLYIENKLPPLNMLLEEGCEIVIGTDSLASNNKLSILEEIKTLQKYFPELSLAELVRWATLNGAKALNEEDRYGTIEAGRKPGLLLIQNADLVNLKLLPESFVNKLI
jgi:cytosine/adenosine deaminase-related metal-dependent hydrolase